MSPSHNGFTWESESDVTAGKRLWQWVGGACLLLWAILLYREHAELAIPAFGSADQAAFAMQQLRLRYAIYLVAGGVLWAGLGLSVAQLRAMRARKRRRRKRTVSAV